MRIQLLRIFYFFLLILLLLLLLLLLRSFFLSGLFAFLLLFCFCLSVVVGVGISVYLFCLYTVSICCLLEYECMGTCVRASVFTDKIHYKCNLVSYSGRGRSVLLLYLHRKSRGNRIETKNKKYKHPIIRYTEFMFEVFYTLPLPTNAD